MIFRVGMKVVCVVPSSKWHTLNGEIVPELNVVYTVRATLHDYIRVVEIVNTSITYNDGTNECWFHNTAFRPVVERKTDISIFQKMLTDERLPDLVVLHRLLERT